MASERIVEKRKQVRNDIIELAGGIFSKFGFKKATMDDIARAADMGKSSLYYYFKSKEEVFEAVVIKEAEMLRIEIDKKVIRNYMPPQDKLREYVLIRMRFLKEMVNFYSALKNDYLGNLAFTEKVREKYDLEEQQFIQKILKEGIELGVFKIKETKAAAMVILTALKGVEVALLIKNELEMDYLETFLDDMLNVFYYGLIRK